METICGYSFRPHDIDAAARQPGISAFMRIRNGEEFVESTIRSHVDCLDEIVAVYHDTSDATPAILMRLAGEYGPKLRVIHYLDTVAPLASREHVRLPADAPGSFINVSNFAFAATTRRHFMLLDDDHLAWDDAFATLCAGVRRGEMQDDRMWCISAFNLMRGPGSQLGVPSTDPFAGNGDHGLRAVRPGDFFEKDNRFERFVRNGRRREFKGFAYWHMKYLKRDAFANHDRERDL
ncbi:MAG TPA: hypothetical protein PKE65_08540, partial [Rhizobiaceae bacterium]|nr:hypothetical protein [Rhizobiaceae bacterium]